MQNINTYITEKFRMTKDYVDINPKLQKTFKQTIKKNYTTFPLYVHLIEEFSDIKIDIDELTDGFKIHKEIMDNIDEILNKMKSINSHEPEYYELNEYLSNYDEVCSLYSIVETQCEYAYVENKYNECVLYYTEYFNDVALLGIIIRGQEEVWISYK